MQVSKWAMGLGLAALGLILAVSLVFVTGRARAAGPVTIQSELAGAGGFLGCNMTAEQAKVCPMNLGADKGAANSGSAQQPAQPGGDPGVGAVKRFGCH